jgi:hypothetical protein
MDNPEKTHDELLQALVESIDKVFSADSPHNIFIPPPIPNTPIKEDAVTSPVTNTPQDYNSPPY